MADEVRDVEIAGVRFCVPPDVAQEITLLRDTVAGEPDRLRQSFKDGCDAMQGKIAAILAIKGQEQLAGAILALPHPEYGNERVPIELTVSDAELADKPEGT